MKSLYTKKCEFLNTLSHALGAVFSLFAIYILINTNSSQILPIIIYGSGMFIMFFASATYHGAKNYKLKAFLQKMDHSAIYVFIPSCFVIFLSVIVDSSFGYFVLMLQYLLAIFGIILNFVKPKEFKKLHLAFYLGIGWSALLFIPSFLSIKTEIFLLTLLGGILYTIGVYFYKQRREYSHFIWHIFIILASLSQFIANYMMLNL